MQDGVGPICRVVPPGPLLLSIRALDGHCWHALGNARADLESRQLSIVVTLIIVSGTGGRCTDSPCLHPFLPLRCSVVVHPVVSMVRASNSRAASDLLASKTYLQGKSWEVWRGGQISSGQQTRILLHTLRSEATCITHYHNCTTVSSRTLLALRDGFEDRLAPIAVLI